MATPLSITLFSSPRISTSIMDINNTFTEFKNKTEEKIVENVTKMQQGLAASVDRILTSMPDSTEKDRALRKLLSTYAPTPVHGTEWSLINSVDYDFKGFSGQHLSDYSILQKLKHIDHKSFQVPSLLVIHDMALASKLSYEDPVLIHHVCKTWNMETSAPLNFYFKDIRAFIMHDRDNIVLCFRGTEIINPKDWSTDVKLKFTSMIPQTTEGADGANGPYLKEISKKNPNPILVHFGFYNALGLSSTYEGVSPYSLISGVVRQMLINHPHKKLWVTGHSLGGALASVFIAQLLLDNEKDILQNLTGLYTFGQPRCGNSDYKKLFEGLEKEGLIHRTVNKTDLVCKLPLKLASYVHHGVKISISGSKLTIPIRGQNMERIATIKKSALPVNSTLKKIMFLLLPEALEDHYPSEYVRSIQLFI